MRFEILTSTPPTAVEGSGTFVAIDGLARGLARLGHAVALRSLRARTPSHTFDRWLYNVAVAVRPPAADVVVGVDLDGYRWARRARRPPFVVLLKGVIADELQNETGVVRALLALQARWERANALAADRVVVPSAYSADVARRAYGIAASALAVVPEGIDVADWQRRLGESGAGRATRPTVLSVARTYRRKRLEDLLAAAALLRRRIPRLAVRIVGAGPESPRLASLHARLGLGDTVTLLGAVAQQVLVHEYASAHCFCLPSVQEGFGIAFAEAMAAGLPVVACRAAAVPEVVSDGGTGILVAPADPEALATALEALLTDEARARALGAAGARRVLDFDLDAVTRRFLDVLP